MLFIHQYAAISAQATFPNGYIDEVFAPVENKLYAKEPLYEEIPKGSLRRMSKPVRMGIGAAMAVLKDASTPAGIIIGTANAGMDDCFRFLEQLIQYEEGPLTPGSFVQSTPNALPGQLGMMTQNHGYNVTHVHLGTAFENALIDAAMMVEENPEATYLVGAVDDISAYNHNINRLDGWYKENFPANGDFYATGVNGSIPGEGAAMFHVSGKSVGSIAGIVAIDTLHTSEPAVAGAHLARFLALHLPEGNPLDIFLSGENGDQRMLSFYMACEAELAPSTAVLRFKHLSGEFPTASSMGVWISCSIFQRQRFPQHLLKSPSACTQFKYILLYNTFKGVQHSFILLSAS